LNSDNILKKWTVAKFKTIKIPFHTKMLEHEK
jgi:hypothetical protein